MDLQDTAIQILKEAGKPLHAKDVAERIIVAGFWESNGKTQEAIVIGVRCKSQDLFELEGLPIEKDVKI